MERYPLAKTGNGIALQCESRRCGDSSNKRSAPDSHRTRNALIRDALHKCDRVPILPLASNDGTWPDLLQSDVSTSQSLHCLVPKLIARNQLWFLVMALA